ncbi:MAG: HNH endonuclease [Acinetobacter junii]
MTSSLHEQYKAFGKELIYALAENLEGNSEIIFKEEFGIYQTLKLPNMMSIRFLQWREKPYPYYIILFDEKNKYVFELDLSMLVVNGELYSWNLKIPSNNKNKAFLIKFLGEKKQFLKSYCAQVKQVKYDLDAGVRVDHSGHIFLNAVSWDKLIDSFIVLMNKAIHAHEICKSYSDMFSRKKIDDIDQSVLEGNPKFITHIVRERNKTIIENKKRSIQPQALNCEVCGFNFKTVYGKVGEGFCEVHHKIPLHQAKGIIETRLEDLAIVCSNCHRMLHRGKDISTLDDLKKIMAEVVLNNY